MHPNFAVGGRPVSVQRWDGPLLEQPRTGRAALLKRPHARASLLGYLETRFLCVSLFSRCYPSVDITGVK